VIFETTDGDTFDLGVSLGRATGSRIVGGFNTDNLGTSLASSVLYTLLSIAKNASPKDSQQIPLITTSAIFVQYSTS
jgi:hypothetical protein